VWGCSACLRPSSRLPAPRNTPAQSWPASLPDPAALRPASRAAGTFQSRCPPEAQIVATADPPELGRPAAARTRGEIWPSGDTPFCHDVPTCDAMGFRYCHIAPTG